LAAEANQVSDNNQRGSKDSPLDISGQVATSVEGEITTKKAANEAAADAKYRDEQSSNEWLNLRLTIASIAISAVLTVITGLLALFTWKLWTETGRLVSGAEDTAKRQLRAYVGVDEISFNLPHILIPGWKAPDPLPPDGYVFEDFILITVRNFGATPAYELRVMANWQPIKPFGAVVSPDFVFTDHAGPLRPSASQVLDRDQTFPATIKVKDLTGFQAAQNRIESLYVYGYVAYTDVYGRRWHRHFCYVWEPWRNEGHRFTPHTENNDETYEGERQPKMPA
jgi:hypothetical protein